MFDRELQIDLHTHSTASDGSDSPVELVQNAVNAGLDAVALTDHDTVAGLPDFLAAAQANGLCGIPGVELSSHFEKHEIHIVGLFIDPENKALNDLLEERRADRLRRNLDIIRKFQENGYDITEEEVIRASGGESIGRPHIARVLVEKGYFPDLQTVFQRYIGNWRPYYVPRTPLSPETAILAVKRAGGLAIWAHPMLCVDRRPALIRLLKIFRYAGLDGLETYYSMYSAGQTRMAQEAARELSLMESGGSDYHGKNHPNISLRTGGGELHVPGEFLVRMMKRKGYKMDFGEKKWSQLSDLNQRPADYKSAALPLS